MKIVYEQHPYHPDAPAWHREGHWHLDYPAPNTSATYLVTTSLASDEEIDRMKRNDEQFRFHDAESGAEILVVVRTVEAGIAICLSREDDGDTEVVLSPGEVRRLAGALKERAG